ncbi:hypothetical protein D3C83_43380 [compost metagenome]
MRPPRARRALVCPAGKHEKREQHEKLGQSDLHQRHEQRVGRHIGPRGAPIASLRKPPFEKDDDDPDRDHRKVRSRRRAESRGQHQAEGRDGATHE